MVNLASYRPDITRDQARTLGLACLMLAVLFAAPGYWLWREWRTNAYYEHGPLIPVAALAVALMSIQGLRLRADGERGWLPLGLLGVGVLLRVVGAIGGSDFISALALLPALAGVIGYVLGRQALKLLAFPLAYLIFMIPMPFMDDLGFYFQRFSSWAVSIVMNLIGVPVTYQGAEVSLPSANFIVGIPCSGLYSLATLTALGLLYAWILQLPSRMRLLMLLASLPIIAMISNIFRLGSILWVAYGYGSEVAINYYHDTAGIVFWALSLVMMFIVGRSLEWRRTSATA